MLLFTAQDFVYCYHSSWASLAWSEPDNIYFRSHDIRSIFSPYNMTTLLLSYDFGKYYDCINIKLLLNDVENVSSCAVCHHRLNSYSIYGAIPSLSTIPIITRTEPRACAILLR